MPNVGTLVHSSIKDKKMYLESRRCNIKILNIIFSETIARNLSMPQNVA